MSEQIGVITEQGDLGLGFDPLSEKDKTILEQNKNDNDDKTKLVQG